MPRQTNKKTKGPAAKALKQEQKAIAKTRAEQRKAIKSIKDWKEHHSKVMDEFVELCQLQEQDTPDKKIIAKWRKRCVDRSKAFGFLTSKLEILATGDDKELVAWLVKNREKETKRCVKAIRDNDKVLKHWIGQEQELKGQGKNLHQCPSDPPVEGDDI